MRLPYISAMPSSAPIPEPLRIPASPNLASPNLVGMSRAELAAEMAAFGAEPFRARQLWHWIYHRGATDFTGMTRHKRIG